MELNEDGIISMETNERETLRKLGKLVDPKEYEIVMKQIKAIQQFNIRMKKFYSIQLLKEKEFYKNKLSIMEETLLSNQYLKKQVSDMKEREHKLAFEYK